MLWVTPMLYLELTHVPSLVLSDTCKRPCTFPLSVFHLWAVRHPENQLPASEASVSSCVFLPAAPVRPAHDEAVRCRCIQAFHLCLAVKWTYRKTTTLRKLAGKPCGRGPRWHAGDRVLSRLVLACYMETLLHEATNL